MKDAELCSSIYDYPSEINLILQKIVCSETAVQNPSKGNRRARRVGKDKRFETDPRARSVSETVAEEGLTIWPSR